MLRRKASTPANETNHNKQLFQILSVAESAANLQQNLSVKL